MKSLDFLLCSLIFLSTTNFAQTPFDCQTAIEVNNNDPIMVDFSTSNGNIDEEIEDLCMVFPSSTLEENTVWFKYSFCTDGEFIFTATPPVDSMLDLDFVVLKSPTNNCENLHPIRCMFSGENIGSGNDSLCSGATGLALTSIDTLENPGCQLDDDNFLAPISVVENDVIYVAVTTFAGNPNFEISTSDTPIIGCNTVNIDEQTTSKTAVFPNPFQSQLTVISEDAKTI